MGDRLFDVLRGYFAVHGYWTVGLALLLENAGVPVPGETILLFASFLAHREHHLHLPASTVTFKDPSRPISTKPLSLR